MNKLRSFAILLLCLAAQAGIAQPLRLAEAQDAAQAAYPLSRQLGLLQQAHAFTMQHISGKGLPQLGVYGQASYQSEVTTIPIRLPDVSIPELSRDQYRIYGEVVQPLTGLITINREKEVRTAADELDRNKLETELYAVRERVNGIFFGILLLDEQRKHVQLTGQDIQLAINKVSASVAHGTDYRSNLDKLKAQALLIQQQEAGLVSSRRAFVGMLSLLTGRSLPDTIALEWPQPAERGSGINRPELRSFESQQQAIDAQSALLQSMSLPGISLFAQGGYGRPGLNMLDNELRPYYIGGMRLSWSVSNLYTLRKERRVLELQKDMIAARRECFLLQTDLTLLQQKEDVARLQELLRTDSEIVALRSSVKKAALAQLHHGVITVNDYLKEVTAEAAAREQSSLHQLQLLQAEHNMAITSGH